MSTRHHLLWALSGALTGVGGVLLWVAVAH